MPISKIVILLLSLVLAAAVVMGISNSERSQPADAVLSESVEMDRNAVERRNALLMETYRNMDSAGMAALYTSDGKLLPPNSETVSGKENLQGFWQAIMNMGIHEIEIFTGDVERHGRVLIETSTADLKGEDGTVLDKAKYIVVWKRESGVWKMYLDIFNSSMPAQ